MATGGHTGAETHLDRRRWPVAVLLSGFAILVLALGFAAGKAEAAPLSISISGNHFVNGAGQTIRLLGVNHTSSEYACVDGFGYDDGHFDDADAAAIASWNADAVRVPINEDCWLGINGQPSKSQEPLTQAGYQQAVESYVSALNARGLYAILDLHWSAPGTQVAMEQQPMPDNDHSPAFWQSVATTFKDNPAVVFDLFNEPYDPTDPRSGSDLTPQDKVTWNCWETGTEDGPAGGAPCDTSAYDPEGNKLLSYQAAGMQTLLDAIRGTGARQPVMVGGLDFANDLSQWATHAPNDPLNQEAASFHNYMGKSCDNLACWNGQIAPVAAGVPVVTGEFDEDNYAESKCANKSPSTFDQDFMGWADQHGISYLAWGWIVLDQAEKDSEGCGAFYLIDDYGGTPAFPNGTLLHDHLLTLPAGGVTGNATGGATGITPGLPPGNTQLPVGLKILKDVVRPGGATVAFTLSSPENCTGTLTGQTVNAYAVTSAKHKRRHVSLGSVHFSLKAGKAKTVVLTLSKTSRRLLRAKRTLKVRITITLTSAGHRKTTLSRTLTLKTPVRHRHSAH
jgi:endoglucanase